MKLTRSQIVKDCKTCQYQFAEICGEWDGDTGKCHHWKAKRRKKAKTL